MAQRPKLRLRKPYQRARRISHSRRRTQSFIDEIEFAEKIPVPEYSDHQLAPRRGAFRDFYGAAEKEEQAVPLAPLLEDYVPGLIVNFLKSTEDTLKQRFVHRLEKHIIPNRAEHRITVCQSRDSFLPVWMCGRFFTRDCHAK